MWVVVSVAKMESYCMNSVQWRYLKTGLGAVKFFSNSNKTFSGYFDPKYIVFDNKNILLLG